MARPTTLRAAALPLALLLGSALAACGGSDGSSDTADAPATTVAAASTDDFCTQVRTATQVFGLGATSSTSLDSALALLPQASSMLAEAAENAPAELRDDVTVLSDAFAAAGPALNELTELGKAAQADPSKAAELQAATARFQTEQLSVLSEPGFLEAVGNITSYARENCGPSTS